MKNKSKLLLTVRGVQQGFGQGGKGDVLPRLRNGVDQIERDQFGVVHNDRHVEPRQKNAEDDANVADDAGDAAVNGPQVNIFRRVEQIGKSDGQHAHDQC